MKKVALFLADGFEEMEALTPVDILRRGGLDVLTVSVMESKTVTGAHGVPVVADAHVNDVKADALDVFILPGGMPGATNLDASPALDALLRTHVENGKLTCAICAAPLVLGKRGMLKGKKATCYPSFETYLEGAECTGALVQEDGAFILGKGPAAAIPFAFAILERCAGAEKVAEVKNGMLFTE